MSWNRFRVAILLFVLTGVFAGAGTADAQGLTSGIPGALCSSGFS